MKKEEVIKKAPIADREHLSKVLDKISSAINTQQLGNGRFIDSCVQGNWAEANMCADEENGRNLKNIRAFTKEEKISNVTALPISWLYEILPELDYNKILQTVVNEFTLKDYFTNCKWANEVEYKVKVIRDFDRDIEPTVETVTRMLVENGIDTEVSNEKDKIIITIYQR